MSEEQTEAVDRVNEAPQSFVVFRLHREKETLIYRNGVRLNYGEVVDLLCAKQSAPIGREHDH